MERKSEFIKNNYLYSELTHQIIQCALTVHQYFGPGFLESVYENALIVELRKNGLKVEHQKIIPLYYHETPIGEHRLDILVEDKIIVENKAVKEINDIHLAQVLSYLKATGKHVGLLFNFAKTKLEIKRFVL